MFTSDFTGKCLVGDCLGWKTLGEYVTSTSDSGAHVLFMKLDVMGPKNLENSKVTGEWFIETENSSTDMFGCQFKAGNTAGVCQSATSTQKFDDWYLRKADMSEVKRDK